MIDTARRCSRPLRWWRFGARTRWRGDSALTIGAGGTETDPALGWVSDLGPLPSVYSRSVTLCCFLAQLHLAKIQKSWISPIGESLDCSLVFTSNFTTVQRSVGGGPTTKRASGEQLPCRFQLPMLPARTSPHFSVFLAVRAEGAAGPFTPGRSNGGHYWEFTLVRKRLLTGSPELRLPVTASICPAAGNPNTRRSHRRYSGCRHPADFGRSIAEHVCHGGKGLRWSFCRFRSQERLASDANPEDCKRRHFRCCLRRLELSKVALLNRRSVPIWRR